MPHVLSISASWSDLVDEHHDFVDSATDSLEDRIRAAIPGHWSDGFRLDLEAILHEALWNQDGPAADPLHGARRDPRRVLDWACLRALDDAPERLAEVVRGLANTARGRRKALEGESGKPTDEIQQWEDNPSRAVALQRATDARAGLWSQRVAGAGPISFPRLAQVLFCFNGTPQRTVRLLERLGAALAGAADIEATDAALGAIRAAFVGNAAWREEAAALARVLEQLFRVAANGLSMPEPAPLSPDGRDGSLAVSPPVAFYMMQRMVLLTEAAACPASSAPREVLDADPPSLLAQQHEAADIVRKWRLPAGFVGHAVAGGADPLEAVARDEWWSRLVAAAVQGVASDRWPPPPVTIAPPPQAELRAWILRAVRLRDLVRASQVAATPVAGPAQRGRPRGRCFCPPQGTALLVSWGFSPNLRIRIQERRQQYDQLYRAAEFALGVTPDQEKQP